MRFTLLLIVLISSSLQLMGQTFGLGAETGITAGRFSDNQFRRRFTYHMGISTQTQLKERVHLNLGLEYVRKGSTANDTGLAGSGTSFNLDYLELGLLAGFGSENLQFRIGPTYSYLVQASISDEFDAVNISDLINDRELGIKTGVYFKFWDKESAYFSINYYQGLQDTNFNPDERITTNYFQFTLGYLLIANR